MSDRETWVEFLHPGTLVPNYSSERVTHRDPNAVQVPDSVYAFQFYDIVRTKDAESGATLSSDRLNQSPVYYYGGDVFTLADVKRQFPNERILLGNMEGNGYKRVIRVWQGWRWEPFGEDAVLLAMCDAAPDAVEDVTTWDE